MVLFLSSLTTWNLSLINHRMWKQREHSFLGRSMIINVLGASRFWHTVKVIISPQWVVDSKIVWSFVWKGRMENVSRHRSCAPLRYGGLNVADFRAICVALRLCNFCSLRDDFGSQNSGIFLLVIVSEIICRNLTRDLVFFLTLFLFLLRLLTFIGLVFLFSSKSLINMMRCLTYFRVRIFIYF